MLPASEFEAILKNQRRKTKLSEPVFLQLNMLNAVQKGQVNRAGKTFSDLSDLVRTIRHPADSNNSIFATNIT